MNSCKGKGISFNCHDVAILGATAKLFNGKEIIFVDGKSEIHQTLFIGGKKVPCHTETEPIEKSFPKIRKLFDKSRVTIAERATPTSNLLSTGKGMTKEYHSPKPLDIYWSLEAKKRMKH